MPTIAEAVAWLHAGGKSRGLVEQCLAHIDDKGGEGGRTFLKVHREKALAAADFHDRMRAFGAAPFAFPGIPVSIKDLFDIAGEVTTAGSVALAQCGPRERGCARGSATAGGGLHSHRPHQHDGVRVLGARHQPPLRHPAQSS